MTYQYSLEDVRFIQDLYKKSFTQRDMNTLFHNRRIEAGTETKRGDYTNWISKLSPNSKHLPKTIQTAAKSGLSDVLESIKKCKGCSLKEAKQIYDTIFKPLCPSPRFTMQSASGFASVMFQAPVACNSWITYAYFSPQYASDFEIEETDEWTNTFLFLTDRTYDDLVSGKITHEIIMDDIRYGLRGRAEDNNQIPELESELITILVGTN